MRLLCLCLAFAACDDATSDHPDTPRADTTDVAVDSGADDVAVDTGADDVAVDSTTADAVDTSADLDGFADASDPALADAEALFQRVLRGEIGLRKQAIAAFEAALADHPDDARGQLLYGMALLSAVAEDGDFTAALKAQPALEKAAALAPNDLRIPGWIGTVKVGAARTLGIGVEDAVDYMIAAADAFPEFNNVSLAIAFGRFPLDTPYPQMAIDRLVSTASCVDDLDVCRNTTRVPHNFEGALMLFGDVYARVGNKAEAERYYGMALASPDAATWAYRDEAQAVLSDLDGRIARYLDTNPFNDPPFFAEGAVACVACHAP